MSTGLEKCRIQQLPLEKSKGHDAIFNSSYLEDIPAELASWKANRIVLAFSKSLDAQTDVIKNLEARLGDIIVAKKSGVGSHSPYGDVIDIANLLHTNQADCLISIGSSSYSDACKIATLMHATLPPGFTEADMEALVDQETGITWNVKPPTVKLIVVPTSLSASEWNAVSSATNSERKKQHFGTPEASPDLILLDPEVASTSPKMLWLSSGVRAVDHCVETMCNKLSHEEANQHMETGLRFLIKGLKEYEEGRDAMNRKELLHGISECQVGSREAMMGFLIWRIPLGPSHAIGHQIGSVADVMHGVTSCIMLAPVLRYTKSQNAEAQARVAKIFNETLGWEEKEAADAVSRFVKLLGLPTTLSEVGVTEESQIEKIAEKTLTDAWGGAKRQLETKEEVMEILNAAR